MQVVVGSVVTRSPTISLAPAAFNELEQAIKLFESGSVHPIVRQGVVRLFSLRYPNVILIFVRSRFLHGCTNERRQRSRRRKQGEK